MESRQLSISPWFDTTGMHTETTGSGGTRSPLLTGVSSESVNLRGHEPSVGASNHPTGARNVINWASCGYCVETANSSSWDKILSAENSG